HNIFQILPKYSDISISETMLINGQSYVKRDGLWHPEDGVQSIALPGSVFINPSYVTTDLDIVNFFRRELTGAQDFRGGAALEPVNGVPTQVFTFKIAQYGAFCDTGTTRDPSPHNQP